MKPTEQTLSHGDRAVTATSITNSNVVTGDNNLILDLRTSQSPEEIVEVFRNITRRALRLIEPNLLGIGEVLVRDEVEAIERQLWLGISVLLTGVAGTGKSNIGRMVIESSLTTKPVLLLDARQFLISDESGILTLLQRLSVLIDIVGKKLGCRVIIDQIDNAIGLGALRALLDLARDCNEMQNVEVMVIARYSSAEEAYSGGEADLRRELIDGGFFEVVSQELTEDRARKILERLKITAENDTLLELSRNLLNLSLIAVIKKRQPEFDFTGILAEVDLWDHYIDVIRITENPTPGAPDGEIIIEMAETLAGEGLRNANFSIEFKPASRMYWRLLSWRIIRRRTRRVCFFVHDNLLDYLYARAATDREQMPSDIYVDLTPFRARSVLVWMDKIYARNGAPQLVPFLEAIFGD